VTIRNPDCSISDGNYEYPGQEHAAGTHDDNYANYMQILGDTIVLIVTNVRNKYDSEYMDIYVNDIISVVRE